MSAELDLPPWAASALKESADRFLDSRDAAQAMERKVERFRAKVQEAIVLQRGGSASVALSLAKFTVDGKERWWIPGEEAKEHAKKLVREAAVSDAEIVREIKARMPVKLEEFCKDEQILGLFDLEAAIDPQVGLLKRFASVEIFLPYVLYAVNRPQMHWKFVGISMLQSFIRFGVRENPRHPRLAFHLPIIVKTLEDQLRLKELNYTEEVLSVMFDLAEFDGEIKSSLLSSIARELEFVSGASIEKYLPLRTTFCNAIIRLCKLSRSKSIDIHLEIALHLRQILESLIQIIFSKSHFIEENKVLDVHVTALECLYNILICCPQRVASKHTGKLFQIISFCYAHLVQNAKNPQAEQIIRLCLDILCFLREYQGSREKYFELMTGLQHIEALRPLFSKLN